MADEFAVGKEIVSREDVKTSEPKQMFDPRPFEGKRVRIERVEFTEWETHYVDGVWDDSKTATQKGVLVVTEPVTSIVNADGTKSELRVNQRFPLKKGVDANGKVTWTVSKHAKGKLWKLCRKCGVEYISELKGKPVTLALEPSRDINDDRMYLRISV